MMQSRWSDADAGALVAELAAKGIGEDLALRIYTTRLLGQDPRLVLHGGGNTSVKTTARDPFGDEVEVLCVKGSGWDMGTIEPAGLPAVRLQALRRLRTVAALSDEEMVNVQRLNLLDSGAPNPSVETLLHAFLPHKFIDHTHSTAVLALTDQPDNEALCREIYGARVGYVPYVMPGFALAKLAADVFDQDPNVEGLVLLNHGVFSFGASAREAYERMIDLVTAAETYLAAKGRRRAAAAPSVTVAPLAEVAAVLRGKLASPRGDGDWQRVVLDHRASSTTMVFVNGPEVARYATQGVVTPDHVIRTKMKPLIAPTPQTGRLEQFRDAVGAAVSAFRRDYDDYFSRNNAAQATPRKKLDATPAVALVPGVGLFGIGRGAREAAVVADIAEVAAQTILDAEAVGAFTPIAEAETFEVEYWSLEQAKLGKGQTKRLAGQVVLVTGGGGAIGRATAMAFAAEGADVVVADVRATAAKDTARAIGGNALAHACDVTDAQAVRALFDAAGARFGGVDIVVSNAGTAATHPIATMPNDLLRDSFEINFFAHQSVAQNAVRVMRLQGTGGVILFNVSKQAVNPGKDFGAYGAAKAALLFLARQYALEHGSDGIRVNAVNPDRIRSGLLHADMISARAAARGVSEADYMSGNLLGLEVTADDVAQAFVRQALALKTTGDVTTVDGGNIAAVLR
jgi:rhamnulose-1-phosphate aldolase/alcohol dehydrogenase